MMFRITAGVLVVTLALPSGLLAAGLQNPPPPPPPAAQKPQQLPVDVDKIRAALQQNPQTRLNTDELRFYVDIIGRIPTFEEIVGDFDLKNGVDRKSTRLNSSHLVISYAVFCLKKKKRRATTKHIIAITT